VSTIALVVRRWYNNLPYGIIHPYDIIRNNALELVHDISLTPPAPLLANSYGSSPFSILIRNIAVVNTWNMHVMGSNFYAIIYGISR